jgi:hypothetical protein
MRYPFGGGRRPSAFNMPMLDRIDLRLRTFLEPAEQVIERRSAHGVSDQRSWSGEAVVVVERVLLVELDPSEKLRARHNALPLGYGPAAERESEDVP